MGSRNAESAVSMIVQVDFRHINYNARRDITKIISVYRYEK